MALSILFITSCSKDDDNNNSSSTNSYTYNGEISEIKFAGIVDHTVGYEITLSPTVVPDCFDYNSDFFHLILPIEKLGLKCNLNEDNRGGTVLFEGFFFNNNTQYSFISTNETDRGDDITGTNNWVKVTKNSGTNNFTVAFEMTIGGKLLKGSYTGVFKDASTCGK